MRDLLDNEFGMSGAHVSTTQIAPTLNNHIISRPHFPFDQSACKINFSNM